MIAQRFRPVGWVAGIAVAACALYMISLQVASERGRLEDVDRKIAQTKREIRQLQTEIGTRASLRQLERWNGEVLALSAPKAGQYLSSEDALAHLDRTGLGVADTSPPPVMMAVMVANTKDAAAPEPSLIAKLTKPDTAPKPMTETDRAVQRAIASAPKPQHLAKAPSTKPEKVAMLDRSLLDRSTMTDLSRAAASETKTRGTPRP